MDYLLDSIGKFIRITCRKILFRFRLIKRWAEGLNAKKIDLRTDEFFMQQNTKEGYNRLDIVVRYLAIENYYSKNAIGFDLYCKMQSKRVSFDYVEQSVTKFKRLIESVAKNGYDKRYAIECSEDLLLLDGSHRVALALYHEIDYIRCKCYGTKRKVAYGVDWFVRAGFHQNEIKIIVQKYNELVALKNIPFVCTLWPPVFPYFDEITARLKAEHKVLSYVDYTFSDETFKRAVLGIYHVDDILAWKIEKKIEYMSPCYPKTIRLLTLALDTPSFRLKKWNNHTLSKEVEEIKRTYRGIYKEKIDNYFYDIIMHISDNFKQSLYMSTLFIPPFSLTDYFHMIEKYNWMLLKHETDYMTSDFPITYPFSKDADILCTTHDYSDLLNITMTFFKKNCPRWCETKIMPKECGCKVRIEQEGFLIYQIDLSSHIKGMSEQFIHESIERRQKKSGYFVPSKNDEICFRFYEFLQFPNKSWHLEYIKQNKDNYNIDSVKAALNDIPDEEIESIHIMIGG